MSIRTASKTDVPALWALWMEAFGEDEAYAAAFFEKHFSPGNSLVFVQGDEICGMLHTVEKSLFSRPARYLYAIATRRAHRSRGIFSALHEAALSRFSEEIFFLIPENESLFSFYAARGYRLFATCPVLGGSVGKELSFTAAWERYRANPPAGLVLSREEFETTALDKRFFEAPAHPFAVKLCTGEVTSFYPDASCPARLSAMALFRTGEAFDITLPCFLN